MPLPNCIGWLHVPLAARTAVLCRPRRDGKDAQGLGGAWCQAVVALGQCTAACGTHGRFPGGEGVLSAGASGQGNLAVVLAGATMAALPAGIAGRAAH